MRKTFNDLTATWFYLYPYMIALVFAYALGCAVHWDTNPLYWEMKARVLTVLFGLGYGFALYTKLENEVR